MLWILQTRMLHLFPSPGDLPYPGIKPGSPALQEDSLPREPPGKTVTLRSPFEFKCLWLPAMSINRKYTSPWKSIMLFYKWWELTQYIFILRLLSDLKHMFAISENGIYFEHIICFEILRIEKHNGQNTCKKIYKYWTDCCCSVTKSCPTLCDLMNCSTSDLIWVIIHI